jgi:hypothetical protein
MLEYSVGKPDPHNLCTHSDMCIKYLLQISVVWIFSIGMWTAAILMNQTIKNNTVYAVLVSSKRGDLWGYLWPLGSFSLAGLWKQGLNEEKTGRFRYSLLTSKWCKILPNSINSCDLWVLNPAQWVNVVHSGRAKVTCWMLCCTWLWFRCIGTGTECDNIRLLLINSIPINHPIATSVETKLHSHPRMLSCAVPLISIFCPTLVFTSQTKGEHYILHGPFWTPWPKGIQSYLSPSSNEDWGFVGAALYTLMQPGWDIVYPWWYHTLSFNQKCDIMRCDIFDNITFRGFMC